MEHQELTAEYKRRRRSRVRLSILLGIAGILVALVVFTQVDRSTIRSMGPIAGSVYDLFNEQDPERSSLAAGQFSADVKALGGDAGFVEQSKGVLGLFGRKDLFSVVFRDRRDGKSAAFGNQELAKLVKSHGDQIWGLYLDNTRVTDEGLRVLEGLTNLRHLSLEYTDPGIARPGSRSPSRLITDAGMMHVGKLTHLQSLHLRGLPITDAGLGALSGLTGVHVLYLDRTQIEGPGLARLSGMQRSMTLSLSGSAITNEGLRYLSAVPVAHLMLDEVPLSDVGLKALAQVPTLQRLEIHRTELDDDDVKKLKKSMPTVDIVD